MAKTATVPADAGDKSTPDKPAAGGKARGNLLPRLSVPLTADKSRFAVENMTDPVRDRLRTVLLDPELRVKLALPDDRPPAPAGGMHQDVPALPDTWDAGITGILWDAIGQLLVAWSVRQGFTPTEAALMEFTDADKAALAGPTAAVLDKYLPGGMARYGPEFALLATVFVIGQGKTNTMRRARAERERQAGPPASGPGTLHHFPSAPGSSSAPAS
jgi:hypothetical protein